MPHPKRLFKRLTTRRNKAARRTNRSTSRRSLRTELLEDRRLLAMDLALDVPLGSVKGVFFGGLGGQQGLEASERLVSEVAAVRSIQQNAFYATTNVGLLPINGREWETSNTERPEWNGLGADPGGGLDVYGSPFINEFAINDYVDKLAGVYEDHDFVVITGYSLGGDTALSLARRLNFGDGKLEVDALALIDASESGIPPVRGYRTLLTPDSVTPNVRYFFNRYQTNYPFPIDYGSSGILHVEDQGATVSDQEKNNDRRNADGSLKKRGCEARDYLLGYCKLFGATKTSRIDHQQIANDDFVEQQFNDILTSQFDSIRATPNLNARFEVENAVQLDSQNQVFRWDVSGAQGVVQLKVLKNGRVIQDYTPVSSSDSYDFNGEGIGRFEFLVFAESFNGRFERHTVTVRDEDTSTPSVMLGGSSGTISDQQNREFTWSMSDASGISNSSVVITGPENLRHSSGVQAGVFSLNSYGPGFYRMTASATDGDNDWSSDQKSSTARPRTLQVYDDDTNKPNIAFFDRLGDPLLGSATSESHGLDNVIAWDIQDQSGISSANATLRRDGVVVKSLGVDATGSMSLDEFGLGQFELTLTATDGDTDGWVGDSLTEVSKAYLTVTNQPPTVFVGGPYAIDEGDLLGLDATGSDADPGDTETLAYSWDLDGDGVFGDVTSRNPVLTWQELQPFGMADDGTYPVVVRVDDTFGESAFSSALVTVNNAAPSIVSIQAPPTVSENAPVTLTGSFADDGSEDTHTVLVNWGDGSTSDATVDALSRTFTATHTYVDDQPTATSSDDYTVEVTVIDDDGGVSGDELRTATAQTSHIGGVAFPSFSSSLPAGTNGLMLEAETTVSPQQVVTSTEPPQEYLHTHTIDYPPNGGPFNLDPVTTDVADAARDHSHAFPGTSQTLEFTGGDLGNFGQERSISMNAVESSVGGTPAEHDHLVNNTEFETETTFTYELPSSVINPSSQSNTSYVRLNGDARFVGIDTHFTPKSKNKMGSMVVRAARRTRSFNVSLDHEMLYSTTIGYGGMSFGYAPMSTNSLFGAKGLSNSTGLWITLENRVIGFPVPTGAGVQIRYQNLGILSVFYNGTEYANWPVADGYSSSISAGGLRNYFSNMTIDVHGTRVRINNQAIGQKTVYLPSFNPTSSWRFGFGGEN